MNTQTILKVTDNSGAIFVKCIKVPRTKNLTVGGILTVVIKKKIVKKFTKKSKEVKKGQVCNALIVRSKLPIKRKWGNFFISSNSNCVVLINKGFLPLGSRIIGVVYRELRANLKLSKIFNLAQVTL